MFVCLFQNGLSKTISLNFLTFVFIARKTIKNPNLTSIDNHLPYLIKFFIDLHQYSTNLDIYNPSPIDENLFLWGGSFLGFTQPKEKAVLRKGVEKTHITHWNNTK